MKKTKWSYAIVILILILSMLLPPQVFALEQVKTMVDKNTIRFDYMDENHNIVCHPSHGYASILRTLDESGRPLVDYFLDESGESVQTSGGYYGILRIYNNQGQASEFVYLDKSGKPVLTKYGYAILKRTYDEDGKADYDTYYDVNGNPIALSRGQCGYRRIYQDGKVVNTIYIDKDGRDMFFLDLFLFKRPRLIMFSMILLFFTSIALGKRERFVLFIFYILFVLYMTLAIRESSEPHSNLEPFWSYRQMLESGTISNQVVYNIVLFVPLGFLAFLLVPRKGWMIPFLLSACIEILQYFTGTGLCEFDDVFSNMMGGLIGFALAMFVVKVFPKVKDGWIRFKR